MTSPRVVRITVDEPTPWERLRRWIEPERYTKRGLVRIQAWGIVATALAVYPTWALASEGPQVLSEPGVIGTTGGAVVATLLALRAFFEFLTASAKRAEQRATQAVAPHEHPEIARLAQRTERLEGASRATWEAVTQIHGAMGEIRTDQSVAQTNVRGDIGQVEAHVSRVEAKVDALTAVMSPIAAALAARSKE